ncbi:5-(carboxyamino)imidazole ribonucleotide mutase [Blattabacterium clevelandi]|uniref:5-(carboxyamino)imidazole ribonucleotide mutase n=1 Tax=Blattabacterium clevelandi TaxID=164516 RepID=UPI000DE57C74|nr:5-(carboxyamino)imidazole ribonucleotide mutase [Blattabacterium clevelandi]
MKVAIFCGSISDKPTMKISEDILNIFNIKNQTYVISAHRLPDILSKTIKKIESLEEGVEIIIAGSGLSAHLPGIIASRTIIPVIGVPLYANNGLLGGIDALFSIVQMPKDVPVATVGINNAYNAALLSVHILAIKYNEIKKLLLKFRMKKKEKLMNEIDKYL